jgi:uncharacterized membrane protein (DUF485 family)
MGGNDASHIRQDPLFQELVHKRARLAWTLSAAMLVIYFGFIAIIAFAPKVLGTPIGNGVTTVGIPVGLLVIASAFVLTGIYVRRANSEFDPITQQIMEKVK